MLIKRLTGVITVRDGLAVQSFGYNRYLPLGRPEILAENLDRWGADEIMLVCIDRSRYKKGPDFNLLERVAKCGLSTPLVYAGGVRSVEDAQMVIQTGADRVCVDAILHDNPHAVLEMSARVGAQALIAALPLAMGKNFIEWLDYRTGRMRPWAVDALDCLTDGSVSEALIIDWRHEGQVGGFDDRLLDSWPCKQVPIIAFGGISAQNQINRMLARTDVAAVAIGNFLSYSEHAIQIIKGQLPPNILRAPQFSNDGVL